MSAAPPQSLSALLDVLHADYAENINRAVAEGQDRRVADLASDYDREATEMVARYEQKEHLLPLNRPVTKRPSFIKRIFNR
jgi:hypothetical protein